MRSLTMVLMLLMVQLADPLSAEIKYLFDQEARLQADMRTGFSHLSFLYDNDTLSLRKLSLSLPEQISVGALRRSGVLARMGRSYPPAGHDLQNISSLHSNRPHLSIAPVSDLDRASFLLSFPYLPVDGYLNSNGGGLLFEPMVSESSFFIGGDWEEGELSVAGWVSASGTGRLSATTETLLLFSRFHQPSCYVRQVFVFQHGRARIGAVESDAHGLLAKRMRFSGERVLYAEIDPIQQLSFRLARSYLRTQGSGLLDPEKKERTISMRAALKADHLSLKLLRTSVESVSMSVIQKRLKIWDMSLQYVTELVKFTYDTRWEREDGEIQQESMLSVTLKGDHLSAVIKLEQDPSSPLTRISKRLVWNITDYLTLELRSGSSRELALIYRSSRNRAVSK